MATCVPSPRQCRSLAAGPVGPPGHANWLDERCPVTCAGLGGGLYSRLDAYAGPGSWPQRKHRRHEAAAECGGSRRAWRSQRLFRVGRCGKEQAEPRGRGVPAPAPRGGGRVRCRGAECVRRPSSPGRRSGEKPVAEEAMSLWLSLCRCDISCQMIPCPPGAADSQSRAQRHVQGRRGAGSLPAGEPCGSVWGPGLWTLALHLPGGLRRAKEDLALGTRPVTSLRAVLPLGRGGTGQSLQFPGLLWLSRALLPASSGRMPGTGAGMVPKGNSHRPHWHRRGGAPLCGTVTFSQSPSF